MVHHWIADQLPTLGCSLEEIVEIEDGKRASSRQWTLCLNSSKIPLYEIDEPRMVPCKTNWRRHQDRVCWFEFWQTIPNATRLNNSMPADFLVK